MRIWNIPCKQLCNKHLLAEHLELHTIYSVITNNKKGYSKHPETLRWVGKLPVLYDRHEEQIREMEYRGWKHRSPLEFVAGAKVQDVFVNTIEEQKEILKNKKCECGV